MIEQEKIYINGTLKAQKISTDNIYRLSKVFNKDRNTIQENILDDTISEITVIESIENIEKDNGNENDDGSGDCSDYTNSEGGEENNDSDYIVINIVLFIRKNFAHSNLTVLYFYCFKYKTIKQYKLFL